MFSKPSADAPAAKGRQQKTKRREQSSEAVFFPVIHEYFKLVQSILLRTNRFFRNAIFGAWVTQII